MTFSVRSYEKATSVNRGGAPFPQLRRVRSGVVARLHRFRVGMHRNSDFSKFRFWPELVKNVGPEPEVLNKSDKSSSPQ